MLLLCVLAASRLLSLSPSVALRARCFSLAVALAERRFAPAVASLRSGTPLRGYPSHSLRSRAPPAHGAAGGYAVRRLAAIRLSRREMLTSHNPSFFFQFILSFLYSFRTFPLVALWKAVFVERSPEEMPLFAFSARTFPLVALQKADFEERSRKKCRFSPFPPEPFHS